MFKGKSFDNFLRLSFFMFMVLTFLSLGQSIYDRVTGEAEQIVLKPALTFMFFAFLPNINMPSNIGQSVLNE